MTSVEFGLQTFGDIEWKPGSNEIEPARVTLRHVVEQAQLAEQVGIDTFGVGEHHRDDFVISAPELVLANIAGCTSTIRLHTAVTVLSSDDPVRVFERFSTLDALSDGRAEIIAGRGSFTESFPLFGFDLAQYEELFEERLELLVELLRNQPVTWAGKTRASLTNQFVYPQLEGFDIPLWVGVGGSPESVVRTARYGLPLMLAIIGGAAARFKPYVELYHKALEKLDQPTNRVGTHSPGFVAATDEAARELLWPSNKIAHDRIGKERGWAPMSYEQFVQETNSGSSYVGSVETVAKRVAQTIQTLGLSRFDLKYSKTGLRHEDTMRSIELYGKEVVPRVKQILLETEKSE